VDGNQGWANLIDRLFVTRDAGKTWADVTPGKPAPGSVGALQPHIGTSLSLTGDASKMLNASSTISTHLGLDGYNVLTIGKHPIKSALNLPPQAYAQNPGLPQRLI
jgi:hypothetical protein